MEDELLKQYNAVKEKYPTVQDNDPASAYRLMITAYTLMETFDSKVAWMYKELAYTEQKAKALTAEKSAEYSNKVAVGDRHTLTDAEYQSFQRDLEDVEFAKYASVFRNLPVFTLKPTSFCFVFAGSSIFPLLT